MNRRWKQKIKKGLCVLLASIIIGDSTGILHVPARATVYAEESMNGETTEWDGVTREKIWELDRCRVTYSLTDHWADGYTAMITVRRGTSCSV